MPTTTVEWQSFATIGAVLLLGIVWHHREQRRLSARWRPVEPMKYVDTGVPMVPGTDLYPLRHPLFCARQAAKQALLLEDHLSDPHKCCPECTKKHFLTMEAFIEEGVQMDKHQKHSELLVAALANLRPVQVMYLQGADKLIVAQRVREIRKELAGAGFEYFS